MCSFWHFISNSPIQHIALHYATWLSIILCEIPKCTVSYRKFSHICHLFSMNIHSPIWVLFSFVLCTVKWCTCKNDTEWKSNEPVNRPIGLYLKRYNCVAGVNHGKILDYIECYILFFERLTTKICGMKFFLKNSRINSSLKDLYMALFSLLFLNFACFFLCCRYFHSETYL